MLDLYFLLCGTVNIYTHIYIVYITHIHIYIYIEQIMWGWKGSKGRRRKEECGGKKKIVLLHMCATCILSLHILNHMKSEGDDMEGGREGWRDEHEQI